MCDIYPCPQLTLKCTNVKPKTCNYLDLTVSVYQGEYNYKSYDKRRDFKFDVVNYPDLSGNIPCRPAYGVFTSQLVRFAKINKAAQYFKNDVQCLVKKLCNQGFNMKILKDKYFEFATRYISLWSRLGKDITNNIFTREIFKLY